MLAKSMKGRRKLRSRGIRMQWQIAKSLCFTKFSPSMVLASEGIESEDLRDVYFTISHEVCSYFMRTFVSTQPWLRVCKFKCTGRTFVVDSNVSSQCRDVLLGRDVDRINKRKYYSVLQYQSRMWFLLGSCLQLLKRADQSRTWALVAG